MWWLNIRSVRMRLNMQDTFLFFFCVYTSEQKIHLKGMLSLRANKLNACCSILLAGDFFYSIDLRSFEKEKQKSRFLKLNCCN